MTCMLLLSLAEAPVLAEENQTGPEVHLGVTSMAASRVEVPVEESSGSVTVLTAPEIGAQNPVSVPEVLRDLPGVSLQESGTIGEAAGFTIRGAESTQTLILLDGIRLNSPFRGGFDFGNLVIDQIGQVEIARGAQSSLYGSEAMGGVVNFETESGKGPFETSVTAAAGNEGTFREALSASEKRPAFDYNLTASRTDTKGQYDRDRFGASAFAGQVGVPVRETGRLAFISRVQDDRKQLAVDIVPDPNDPNAVDAVFDENNKIRRHFSFQSLQYNDRLTSKFDLIWKAAIINSNMNFEKPPDPAIPTSDNYFEKTDSQSIILDLQQNIHVSDSDTVTFGFERYKDKVNSDIVWFDMPFPVEKSRGNSAYYFQNLLYLKERFSLQTGVRLDNNSSFGSVVSPKISAAYGVAASGTRLRGSWGTGFRAPSIQELYFPNFGNPDLDPEKSRSWEGGVQQQILGDRLHLDVAYFRIDFRDLIQRGPTTIGNIGKARTQGVESSLKIRLRSTLTARVNYTYLDAKELSNNTRLPFRPRGQGNVGLLFTPTVNLIINLDINMASSQAIPVDFALPDGSVLHGRSPGYTRVDLSGTYHLFGLSMGIHETRLFIRVKNLLDREYQEVPGFPAPGINFLAGLTAVL